MDALPQNLFELMLELSRIGNRKTILEKFTGAMNRIFQNIRFFETSHTAEPHQEIIEIKTAFSSFGYIAMDYGQNILPLSRKQLIYNAIEMLAILLENRVQQERLNKEKDQIQKEWQKQTESLHELDEQYKALAENSEDIILRFDKDLKIVYANTPAEKLFDIPRLLILRQKVMDLQQPEDQKEFWVKNVQRTFSVGFSVNEYLVFFSGSQKQYFDVKFVPEKNDNNTVTYVFATARDITELKAKEKALVESQWHLKQAQRIAKIGSWEWYVPYNKFNLSDELYHILGFVPKNKTYSMEDLRQYMGDDFYLILESFRNTPPEEIAGFESEMDIRRADGQIRQCVICGEAVIGSNGKLKKLHGTLQDITERKLLETELNLARLKAEESDRLKSAFLANMSHEIRTPLNGILGFSELLKKKNLTTDKRLFYTDIICSNGKQLLNIISDIIDISRIESGQIIIEKNVCHLQDIFREMSDFLITELKAKGKLKLETEIATVPPNGLTILCDEIHLKQVMGKLISNAVKFTDTGKISMGYELKANAAEFFIRDTGIGINAEFHKVIFERFRQANESASREHGGTGLGLAICKHLVELMGGKIWLTSEEGKGSEFRFSIPANASEHMDLIPVEHPASAVLSWPGKKILIVEDDMASFQLLKETLADTYAVLYQADDGEKALLMYQSIKPDLILMDIRLPKINGLNVIQEIRKTDSSISIIAITANAFTEDKINCKAVGADDYIAKPVNHQELLCKIDRFLCSGETQNKIAGRLLKVEK